MSHLAELRSETPTAARWPMWLSMAVLVGAYLILYHDVTVSLYRDYSPWSATEEVRATGANAVKGAALAAIGLLGILFLARREGRRLHFGSLLSWVIVFYLAWAAASITWSTDRALTARRLAVLAFWVLGALGMARQFGPRDLAIVGMAVAGALLAVGLGAELSLGTFRPWSSEYRFAGTLHPNNQATCLVLMCLSAFVLLRASDSRRRRAMLALVIVVGLVFLVLTKSRTSLAACLLAAGTIWLLRAPAAARILVVVGGVLTLLCVLLALSFLSADSERRLGDVALLGRMDESEMLTGRVPMWHEVAGYAAARPLGGYGYESFWTVRHIQDLSGLLRWRFCEAHCGYLDAVLSVGLVGAAAMLLAALLGIGRAASLYRESGRCDYALTLGILIFMMIATALESVVIGTRCITLVALCGLTRLALVPPETTYPEHTLSPALPTEGDWP